MPAGEREDELPHADQRVPRIGVDERFARAGQPRGHLHAGHLQEGGLVGEVLVRGRGGDTAFVRDGLEGDAFPPRLVDEPDRGVD